jgi:chloride channel protein, CIC family
MKDRLVRAWAWWMDRNRAMLPVIFADAAPLDLRLVGRTLLQAAVVGIACGFAGAAFFGILEYTQRLLLEDLAGYELLRASGETFASRPRPGVFRPWLLVLVPTLGGLACGWLTRREPDARGAAAM